MAKALEDKGNNREALNLQQKVVNWIRANPQQGEATTAGIFHAFGRLLLMNEKPNEALGAVEEAVKLRRKFEASTSDAAADLAASLRLKATLYAAVRCSKDVLPTSMEAVAIHRKLAVRDSALTGELALSLNILGLLYGVLGRASVRCHPASRR